MAPSSRYPRWLQAPDEGANLREVAPGLYVGAESSPARYYEMPSGHFTTIVDFYGSYRHATSPFVRYGYQAADQVYSFPFYDGASFPPGALDAAYAAYQIALLEGGQCLLHCQAGLSRSASAAYAIMRRHYKLSHEAALHAVRVPAYRDHFPLPATLASARAWAKR